MSILPHVSARLPLDCSQYTGLFKIIVGVLTTFHTQYTWDSSICMFLFNRTTLQVFVTYLTGALYVRNCRWTIVTDRYSWNVSTQNTLSLPFASILVNCAPSEEMHNYCTPHIKENAENFLIHRCNYILLSQVYCVWQVVKTPTINSNNRVIWYWMPVWKSSKKHQIRLRSDQNIMFSTWRPA
jgi:hypothetical protein